MPSPWKPRAAADSENYKNPLPERLYNQAICLLLPFLAVPHCFSCHPRKFLAGSHLQGFSVHLKTVRTDPATALTSDAKQNIMNASCQERLSILISGLSPYVATWCPMPILVALLRQSEVHTLSINDTDFRKFAWRIVKHPPT